MSARVHICPKCDGEGYIMDRGAQIAAGILSLGMFPLMDAAASNGRQDSLFSYRCKVCNGRGKFTASEA